MKKYMKVLVTIIGMCMLTAFFAGCGSSEKTKEDIQQAGTLVVATSPDFPPFEYLEGSEVKGIEIEILQQVASKMGVTLTIKQMDFEAVVPGIQAGKFDVGASGITINAKRKQNVDFTVPYFLASQAIVVKADSPITCKADLTGKKISVQTGTTAEDFCSNSGYEVLAFTANNDAVEALISGKVDAWVVDNEVALTIAAQQGLMVLDEAMTTEPYAFAFAKGSTNLSEEFNKTITAMLQDGTMENIFKKYNTVFVSPLK